MHALNISTLQTETALQYSTVYYQIEEINFLLFREIRTNATAMFGNRCLIKNINFYGYCFFRTIMVAFISGSGNQKSHDNLFFIFSISFKLF